MGTQDPTRIARLFSRHPPAQALALCGGVRRAVHDLRGLGPGRAGAADVLGVYDRAERTRSGGGTTIERTRLIPRRGALDLAPGRLRIRDDGVLLDLTLDEDEGIEATCPNGGAYVWTRKQAGVRAHGTLVIGRAPTDRDRRARRDRRHRRLPRARDRVVVGRRCRQCRPTVRRSPSTSCRASTTRRSGSERAVWVAGVPHEAPPVRFSADLRTIASEDGSELRFAPEAERSRSDNLLLVRSDYRAPFGTFSGTLPGGIPLTHALGVVEHHRARW